MIPNDFSLNQGAYTEGMGQWGAVQRLANPSARGTAFGNFSLTRPGSQNFDSFSLNDDISGMKVTDDNAIIDNAGLPDVAGGWLEKGKFGLGLARIGLGVYGALEQAKMNKFMRGYYGDQVALQKADFANAARGANEALSSKRERVLSAQGTTTGTDANRTGVADYMKTWGAQESI